MWNWSWALWWCCTGILAVRRAGAGSALSGSGCSSPSSHSRPFPGPVAFPKLPVPCPGHAAHFKKSLIKRTFFSCLCYHYSSCRFWASRSVFTEVFVFFFFNSWSFRGQQGFASMEGFASRQTMCVCYTEDIFKTTCITSVLDTSR